MPTLSDILLETANSADYDKPTDGLDTRLRLGYPRVTVQGTTPTDATAARNAASTIPSQNLPTYDGNDITQMPAADDALVDVKRAAMFAPHTGVNVISGGRFNTYLRHHFNVQVLDGMALFQAVDQSFVPDPEASADVTPGLSYFRMGAPEPARTGTDGKPLERELDLLMDQRYTSGIGMYSDGELNAWTKGSVTISTNSSFNVIADEKSEEIVGENYEATYSYVNESDEELVKKGEKKPTEVERKIVGVEMKRKGATGWYMQEFKRGMSLDFSAANKGEVSFNAAYGISLGAKTEHGIGLAYETSIAGKIEFSKSWGIELGAEGAVYKGTAGKWTQSDDNVISANNKITLKVRDLGELPFHTAAKVYKVAAGIATASQMAAFIAYNTTLLATADRALSPVSGADKEKSLKELDNAHGLGDELDAGIYMYETSALLSAVTAAGGALLAALQAKYLQTPVDNPLAPRIDISPRGVFLRFGMSGIEITSTGVRVVSLGGRVEISGTTILNKGAAIQHQAGPIVPLRVR